MGRNKISLADKMKKVNELQSQGVKKGQGADSFFKSTIAGQRIENTGNNTDIETGTYTSPCADTKPSTDTDTTTDSPPATVVNTDSHSVLDSLLSSNEQFVRCVAYLRKDQSDFVKDLSKQLTKKNKGKRIKESEIFRMAMDMLMDAVKK
ncbi:hypothetical protein LGL55_18845 [Clostridium tagluense]|uniref:hypothetical protein n=1 Tax=Clostridium tagluense TaxID=360422 RepID=UPI001C0C8AB6|nr:hypothetical protein [Clostridium tagluense]MBU3130000.1 hypothetical protein [Clostridium tagluense]MCB2311885.1 hypothetical protein [Clostridium tagluense]MCB2317361.1 hypothetical protein [Clostridium tagluense]MCB2322847.1 hypothetical protein [Clostridium tagluense]MCB2326915.1 hypothetical protein [Clostridium tagluense]